MSNNDDDTMLDDLNEEIEPAIKNPKYAFAKKDGEASRKAHEAKLKKGAPEHHSGNTGTYLKAIVFGGLDGIITTFAIVAGVAGAGLSTGKMKAYNQKKKKKKKKKKKELFIISIFIDRHRTYNGYCKFNCRWN